jgi:hypothetical protein
MATACERAECTAFMQNFDIHGIRSFRPHEFKWADHYFPLIFKNHVSCIIFVFVKLFYVPNFQLRYPL